MALRARILWRRLKQLEKLPANMGKQGLAVIDAFIERHRGPQTSL